ncbi:protein of unknown function [Pseudorhizobium banfieldiae]|uniref:Uncharacterized protein n=1 Tax=Pseudorhizobium banfieldiae TaxID=1125847 RepID=L0NG29_9HYPH|nr:protein of unknown function [Pseudorhizobium banfieldiae]
MDYRGIDEAVIAERVMPHMGKTRVDAGVGGQGRPVFHVGRGSLLEGGRMLPPVVRPVKPEATAADGTIANAFGNHCLRFGSLSLH